MILSRYAIAALLLRSNCCGPICCGPIVAVLFVAALFVAVLFVAVQFVAFVALLSFVLKGLKPIASFLSFVPKGLKPIARGVSPWNASHPFVPAATRRQFFQGVLLW